jgi:glycosyltransferase involved in cell wall biosynthesis
MQVQMSPVVARAVAGLKHQGFSVDVVAAENFLPFIPCDESLMSYVQANSNRIYYIAVDDLIGRWRSKYPNWMTPDIMASVGHSAFKFLTSSIDIEAYSAVVTFSPFHSINTAMLRVKKTKPKVRWVAHFCDPWAGNPLEQDWFRQLWNEWYEPKMLKYVDFITNSSRFTLEMILRKHQNFDSTKASVIPHFFDSQLYPQRPKAKNQQVILRFVGTLFGRRTPQPLFQAVFNLLIHRPDLQGIFTIELVGKIDDEMLLSETAKSLPPGLIKHIPPVNYLNSLELMYDADILLLIEADTDINLFVPSKLADYMGADTPIIGLATNGSSREILDGLECWITNPNDIAGIEKALESAINYVLNNRTDPWCNEVFKNSFSLPSVSRKLGDLI